MLTLETLIRSVSSKLVTSMVRLILVIPLLMSLASCAGEEAGGIDPNSGIAHADGGDEDPIVTMSSTGTGVTAQVTWEPPPGFVAAGYEFYYGKQSSDEVASDEIVSDEPVSCTRGEKETVDAPQATITGLEPNAQYFFVIRAFNEDQSETMCSNEITAETTPAQS
ncbi:MAG: fibronectin type III domain-containing protein [Nitrospira sp.]|nr:fibronectin type III domain-containing protein [Nitrospira sp.]